MRVRWPLNRGDTLGLGKLVVACLALVVAVLALIPNWLPFLEARGYDAAWLIPALQLVQRARWVIVALAACPLAVLLVWKFWRQLVRLFKWLGGLPTRFYLWLLWHLVIRPARDHLGQLAVSADEVEPKLAELSSKMWDHIQGWLVERERTRDVITQAVAAEEAERALSLFRSEMSQQMEALAERRRDSTPRQESAWAQEVDDLSIVAAWLFDRILYLYRREPGGKVFMLHEDLNALADEMHSFLPTLREACEELEGAHLLLGFEWREVDQGIQLIAEVAERVKSRKVAGHLRSAIRTYMEAEGVWS